MEVLFEGNDVYSDVMTTEFIISNDIELISPCGTDMSCASGCGSYCNCDCNCDQD